MGLNTVRYEDGTEYAFGPDERPYHDAEVDSASGPWFEWVTYPDVFQLDVLWDHAYGSGYEYERKQLGDDLDEYLSLLLYAGEEYGELDYIADSVHDVLSQWLEETYSLKLATAGLAIIDWDAVSDACPLTILEGKERVYVLA